jgi:hypothetical protein
MELTVEHAPGTDSAIPEAVPPSGNVSDNAPEIAVTDQPLFGVGLETFPEADTDPGFVSPRTRSRAAASDRRLGDNQFRPNATIELDVNAVGLVTNTPAEEDVDDDLYKPGADWRQLRRPPPVLEDKSAEMDGAARKKRSLWTSGFPWIGNQGEVQPQVLWERLYREEAADALAFRKGDGVPAGAGLDLGPEPVPEPEPESVPPTDDFGLRSWSAPVNGDMDLALKAAEEKREALALKQAEEMMAALASGGGGAGGFSIPTYSEVVPSTAVPSTQEAPVVAESSSTAWDKLATATPDSPGIPTDLSLVLEGEGVDAMTGVRGEGDWFCAARLREAASVGWANFRAQVPAQAKAVQPLVELWLTNKAEERRQIMEKNAAESARVKSWLASLGLGKHEEVVRDYIGMDGGLVEIAELEPLDLKDLIQDLDLDQEQQAALRKSVADLKAAPRDTCGSPRAATEVPFGLMSPQGRLNV